MKRNLRRPINLLVLFFLFVLNPMQQLSAQITLSVGKTTLGKVIETVKSQSKYEFFFNDKLSNMEIDALKIEDASIDQVLTALLKGKSISYKVEENIVYLSAGKEEDVTTMISKQQNIRKVSGTVVDETGEALIGVNVSVEGTSQGTITDFDGKFVLDVPAKSKVLFSYIGYRQVAVMPKGSTPLEVTMEEDTQAIDEVVVTALGIKREKKMLGYSIQDLKGDKMNKTGDPSVTSMLQGKVAGLQMNTASTGLGGSTKITLRGNSSLTDNNQPLWVIDGVPFNDNNNSSASTWGGVDRGGASADINPDDIESISVLKGPNAAALYGSRAGNGVILVTTKRGAKSDGFGVTYSGSCTWTTVAETLNRQTKYGQGSNGVFDPTSSSSFGAELDGHPYVSDNYGTQTYSNYGNPLKDYFSTGFSQTHNLSVGNVTEKANYRVSFGTTQADGMFKDESMEKMNIDVKAGMELNKYFSVDSKISLSRMKAENRPVYGQYGEVYQLFFLPNNISLSSIQKFKSDDKRHIYYTGPNTTLLNPYYLNYRYTNSDERWRAFGYYAAKFNITSWLHASAKYSFDYYNTSIEDKDLTNGCTDAQEKESYRSQENSFYEHNIEFMVIGENQLSDRLRLGYTLGSNMMYQKIKGIGANSSLMNTPGYWYHNSAQGFNSGVQMSPSERRTNSIFGTMQLAWNEYLALDLTARNDWSSTLPTDNNSYFYPSANLSFVMTDFMDKMNWTKPSWLTFAKMRLSIAQVGKDTDPYQLQNYLNWEQTESGPSSKNPSTKANSELKPEISTAYEGGLDMKFFNNRLGFDFTYYYSLTKNQIMAVPMSLSSGFDNKWINAGEIVNKGLELMVYTTPIKTKDFTFNLDVNFAKNTTTVKKLTDGSKYMSFSGGAQDMMVDVGASEGGKLGDIYPIKTAKKDANGNVVTRNGLPLDAGERSKTPIGNIQPDLLMSVTPSFTYKGFTLSALFDMKFGGDIVSISEAIATGYGTAKRTENREDMIVKGVNEDGTPNTTPISAELFYSTIGSNQGYAEYFMYDASFIKLKELSLSYSFPRALLKKTPFSSFRVSVVGRNLVYLVKHTPGTSPEGGYNTSMFSQAIDFTSVPYSRTFGFSVNASF
ncbi:MAG: SusC/RagA family TonB-linked outer membrane protein [Bacteroidaceae bacterium]